MRKPRPEKPEKVLEKGSGTEGRKGKASPAATVALTLPKCSQLASHGPGVSLTSLPSLPLPTHPAPVSGKEGSWRRTWTTSEQVWVEWKQRSFPEGRTGGSRMEWLGERGVCGNSAL